MQKYVASTTLEEPVPWADSTLSGDAVDALATLREEACGDLVILGRHLRRNGV